MIAARELATNVVENVPNEICSHALVATVQPIAPEFGMLNPRSLEQRADLLAVLKAG